MSTALLSAGPATAVVTGAASGLGAATAELLSEAGWRVVGLDLESAIAGVGASSIELVATDVTDPDQVTAAVEKAAQTAPVRLAVSCAGIAPSARLLGRSGVHDPSLFEKVLRVNLFGTFHVMSAAAAAMAQAQPVDEDGQRGVIINTASVAAFEGQVGQVAYAASKGGVHSMTISAARDLASQGIRVNAIAPGVVWTPMMEGIAQTFRDELVGRVQFPHRFARPREYAQLVQSIAENPYLNGETIRLDGGLRMPPR